MYSNRPYQSIKKQVGVVILLLAFFISAYSQYDSCWIIGDNQTLLFDNDGTVKSDTPYIHNRIIQSSIRTSNGNFLYSDNMYIYNKYNDTLYNRQALPFDTSIIDPNFNRNNSYSSIFLNTPDTNIYYFVTKRLTYSTTTTHQLNTFATRDIYIYIYKIDTRLNNNRGEVFAIDTIAYQTDTFAIHRLNVVRHANGKDWWIVCHGVANDVYYKFLYSDHLLLKDTQRIGNIITYADITYSNLCFSLNGDKICVYIPTGNRPLSTTVSATSFIYELYDFDRCTGKLSNYRSIDVKPNPIPTDPWFWGNSTCAFSPNGENIYINTRYYLYQYHIPTAQLTLLWDTVPGWFQIYHLKLAPNGKIYALYLNGDTTPNWYAGVIHQPDAVGAACQFEKAGLPLLSPSSSLAPNTTNYTLGAVPLMDNHQVYHDTICEGDIYSRAIDSFSNSYYRWYANGTLLSTDRVYSSSAITQNTMLTMRLGDISASCSERMDTVFITVNPAPCTAIDTPFTFSMPTAFSPNGDGKNEVFYPVMSKAVTPTRFAIYNRWGQQVHSDPTSPWTGNGQTEGVYYYVVEIAGEVKSGVVNIVR